MKAEKEVITVKEQLSAMLDGELDPTEVDCILRELDQSVFYKTAEIYFQIGDVLREREAFLEPSRDLAGIIRERLKSETYLSVDLDDPDRAEEKKQLTIDV